MVTDEESIPLVEERAVIEKREREAGRVQVRTRVERREEVVEGDLLREDVAVERVRVGREVDDIPDIRQENGVTIVPVVEEVLVVEKRLVLVEEVHLRRTRHTEHVSQPVTLASQRAEIVRDGTGEGEA